MIFESKHDEGGGGGEGLVATRNSLIVEGH